MEINIKRNMTQQEDAKIIENVNKEMMVMRWDGKLREFLDFFLLPRLFEGENVIFS